MMDEDWKVLTTLFPSNWRELAASSGALKGLRKDKGEENLLRTLLIHLGCGYSLRETVTCARQAGLADMSDVALLKRLKKCKGWLHALCMELLSERGTILGRPKPYPIRIFDATHVAEPGKTGSIWRVHYSILAPSMHCDFFRITPIEGVGTGESFLRFPINKGDLILADRGYSLASGIEHVHLSGAFVTVRFSPSNVLTTDLEGKKFDLLSQLAHLTAAGETRSWPVLIPCGGRCTVQGRICAIRKSEEAIRQSHARLKRRESKNGEKLRDKTLVYAEYIIVFTTFPEDLFSVGEVLEWYRIRWQIELVFKRFKQIAQLGHLPKHDDESAEAWLYGKLFIALVTEKLIRQAESVSPWGYEINTLSPKESVA